VVASDPKLLISAAALKPPEPAIGFRNSAQIIGTALTL
jgi:hypothetical protein